MKQAPERIVSLVASGTELVCALGLGHKLVGRSHECDYPTWVKRLPEVSRPTFDISGSSREIDERVCQRLHRAEALYEVDEGLLLELAPDVLITHTHCEVCAVSAGDFAQKISAKLQREQVLALSSGTLEAILQGFTEVAAVLADPEAGTALVSSIRQRLAQLAQRTSAGETAGGLGTLATPAPSWGTTCCGWRAPQPPAKLATKASSARGALKCGSLPGTPASPQLSSF